MRANAEIEFATSDPTANRPGCNSNSPEFEFALSEPSAKRPGCVSKREAVQNSIAHLRTKALRGQDVIPNTISYRVWVHTLSPSDQSAKRPGCYSKHKPSRIWLRTLGPKRSGAKMSSKFQSVQNSSLHLRTKPQRGGDAVPNVTPYRIRAGTCTPKRSEIIVTFRHLKSVFSAFLRVLQGK